MQKKAIASKLKLNNKNSNKKKIAQSPQKQQIKCEKNPKIRMERRRELGLGFLMKKNSVEIKMLVLSNFFFKKSLKKLIFRK